MIKKILLVCGMLCSLFVFVTDILAAMIWQDYSYIDQSVSELSAIGTPTRFFVVPLLITSALLGTIFGIGVLLAAGKKSALRITGILLIIFGVVCSMNLLFPMNLRGTEQSFTGIMHLLFTGINIVLIILFIGFGAAARGKGFRIFSTLIILAILIFGAFIAMQAPHVEAGLPTPLLGAIERVSYYSPYLWITVFALVLLLDQSNTTISSSQTSGYSQI